MATKPELRRAVANAYIKASDYNYNFEQLNNYIENGVADNAINNYEANREYSKGQWVLANTSEGKGLYESQVDGNKGNSLLDTTYWKKLILGGALNLFDIVLKDYVLTYEETKGLALQGTYVYKEALAGSYYGYPDFYNKVIEEYNEATNTETINGVTVKVNSNGHKFYDIADKTAIDELFNNMGTAWFYGIDTENERIFLPRDKYFAVKGNVAVAGDGKTLGITDGVTNFGLQLNTANTALAIDTQSYGTSVGSDAPARGGETGITYGVTTDPMNSGIEGQLTPNEEKYLYICVGNTTNYEGITNVVDQGMEILEQVNQGIESRVKLDGSNAEFPHIVKTYNNGTSWYRIWSDGFCIQGAKYFSEKSLTGNNPFTLLKEFADTNYCVFAQQATKGTTGGTPLYVMSESITTTSFVIDANSAWTGIYWQACGYLKEGEY